MNQNNGLTFLLFALVTAGTAAVGLPLFGLTPELPSEGPAASASPRTDTKPKAPQPPQEAKAGDPDAKPAVPAPRKKTRVVWVGGGGPGPGDAPRGAGGAKAGTTNVPRMSLSSGSAVKIQPVGGYVATTATAGGGARRGG